MPSRSSRAPPASGGGSRSAPRVGARLVSRAVCGLSDATERSRASSPCVLPRACSAVAPSRSRVGGGGHDGRGVAVCARGALRDASRGGAGGGGGAWYCGAPMQPRRPATRPRGRGPRARARPPRSRPPTAKPPGQSCADHRQPIGPTYRRGRSKLRQEEPPSSPARPEPRDDRTRRCRPGRDCRVPGSGEQHRPRPPLRRDGRVDDAPPRRRLSLPDVVTIAWWPDAIPRVFPPWTPER